MNNHHHDWCQSEIEKANYPINHFFGNFPKYHKMLFSFKPLKYKNWLSQEQINKLK